MILGTGISVLLAMNFMAVASDREMYREYFTHILLVRRSVLPLRFRKR